MAQNSNVLRKTYAVGEGITFPHSEVEIYGGADFYECADDIRPYKARGLRGRGFRIPPPCLWQGPPKQFIAFPLGKGG